MVERAYLLAAESNTIKQVAVNFAVTGQEPGEVARWFKDLQDGWIFGLLSMVDRRNATYPERKSLR